MKPTWRQIVRFVVTASLLGAFIAMFLVMGLSVVGHSQAEDKSALATLVTAYGTFIAIVGSLIGLILKDLFDDK